MARGEARPPILTRAEVVIGNAIPVAGVALLGWDAVQVVTLYVLDGWLSILGLGASVMIRNRDEMRQMVPRHYSRLRRGLFWVAAVGGVEALLSIFALVPGVAVLAHMSRWPGDAVAGLFRSPAAAVPALMLVASHGMRVARGIREPGEGVWALPPKAQMALFAYRMFGMMFLAWLAGPGFLSRFLVPVYVALIGALFTYSDLYPRRFLARLRAGRWATAHSLTGSGTGAAGRPPTPRG